MIVLARAYSSGSRKGSTPRSEGGKELLEEGRRNGLLDELE